jgi:antibiotic biosynthesis monooxygenase (ABM) superfamily enzyme
MHPDHNAKSSPTDEGPVTVIVRRRAKSGRTQEFEEWMDGITHAAMNFEGHMGVNIIRPAAGSGNPEYVIIFRFDSYQHLSQWEGSQIRNEWLRKGVDVTDGEPIVEKQTGLEFWFTPTSGAPAPVLPPRHKMAIVVTGIIFVLVSTILPQIRQVTIGLPVLLSTLVGVVIMVLLMTYVIMPLATRLLKPWLSRKSFL